MGVFVTPLDIHNYRAIEMNRRIDNTEFAVVDTETTGLFPQGHDRIVEIAVIRIDGKGGVLDEYTTLVNPNRDLGATYIHGITAKEVRNAPVFQEIGGDLVDRLANAVFVAHNANFDFRFLQAEFTRLGCPLPDIPVLCTMQFSKLVDPKLPGRKLQVCCHHFGIPLNKQHSAYHDASATAKLFTVLLKRIRRFGVLRLADIGIQTALPEKKLWPQLSSSGVRYTRTLAAKKLSSDLPYLARLVTSLPASDTKHGFEEYFSVLDHALEDRRVTLDEAKSLFGLAKEIGMSPDQVQEAHRLYMKSIITVALQDGVVSQSEKEDLNLVRQLLSISEKTYEKLLLQAKKKRKEGGVGEKAKQLESDLKGKTICFTGTFNCLVNGERPSRSSAIELVEMKGIRVKKSLTMDVDLLVITDPDSMSGKAKKARKYGIRIIAEPVFWRMIGVNIE